MLDIDEVARLNQQVSNLKKELASYKEELKKLPENELEGREYKAIIRPSIRKTLNENKALEIIKKNKLNWLLKEVVNEDALQDALYQKEVMPELFSDCLLKKTTYSVIFKKVIK